MENSGIMKHINSLIMDREFLELKSLQSKSNLFEIVAASHTEMWHSAFLKWVLDPNSSLGLGTFPLKRFLFMVRYEGLLHEEGHPILKLDLSIIEDMKALRLEQLVFDTEYTEEGLKGKRFDIHGVNDILRVTIENKINSRESEDQTMNYEKYLESTSQNVDYDIRVFLSPDESRVPTAKSFIQLSYQQFCDSLLRPCLNHPELSQENQFLIIQYLNNLRKPIRGGRVMALPNKDLCERIYLSHKEVLDEIFITMKGEAPSVMSNDERIKSYNVTLSQMVENNIISLDDRFQANYRGKTFEAKLIKQPSGSVLIKVDDSDTLYGSPSKAAKFVTDYSVNGWTFWSVVDSRNQFKGTLAELRNWLAK